MTRAFVAGFLCVVSIIGSGCRSASTREVIRHRVVIAGMTDRNKAFLDALLAAYQRNLPDVDVSMHTGETEALEALQDGTADIGLSLSDRAYLSYVGEVENGHRLDHLRGIATLWVAQMNFVAAPRSSIRSIADLRGRRIGNIGPITNLNILSARLILKAFGIDVSEVDFVPLEPNELVTGLKDGSLDASLIRVGIAATAVRDAIAAGARLLPISGPNVPALRYQHPFFRLTMIPAGTYESVQSPTPTIGIPVIIVCRSDLAEPLVHELTKQFFEFLSSTSSRPPLPLFDLQSVPATPIPLHEGAARYYRERELFQ